MAGDSLSDRSGTMTMTVSRRTVVATAALLALAFGGAPAALSAGPSVYDYGPAPEFAAIDAWINAEPLTMAGLRGKVVLVEFWTYSCINCLRTLPRIIAWQDAFKDQGLVVIGVHTPEFAYERDKRGLQAVIARLGITYPVAQDNRYATWKAYGNEYWPALYVVDRQGHIVLKHFGEGDERYIENALRALLARDAESQIR
jgi:thiol-disulfide isomerase/thioredoxin